MKKLNENMTRKHNWDQLQYIQKKIEKEGGDISKKLGSHYKNQSKTANSLWIDNPLKKDIDLSDNEPNANTHTDPHLKDLPKNSLIKEFKIFEKEGKKEDEEIDRGNYNKIQRSMKTIRTWDNYYHDNIGGNPNPNKERRVLAGRQTEYGDEGEKGYIEGFKEDGVVVQTIDNKGHKIVKFSDITKNYKEENKEDKKEDLSLQGPNQETKINKEEKSIEVKKLNDKGKEDKKSKKITDKIYNTKDIKLKKLNDFGKTKF